MVALCQAVEELLGGVTLQAAADPEYFDGGEALLKTAAQSLVHCLGIVHLAVAYRSLDAAETQSVGADLSDKVLGGDEIDAAIGPSPSWDPYARPSASVSAQTNRWASPLGSLHGTRGLRS